MMIEPGYVRMMARYNAWQNRQLSDALDGVPLEVLRADHGAFFGSILGTLNHILWADRLWMSRFAPDLQAPPEGGIVTSTELCPTFAVWGAERFAMDGMIARWAKGLHAVDLAGALRFHSRSLGREARSPMAQCVIHMFNHQTHHRGQVHAMLTKSKIGAPVSDLFLMPEETE
ncbi:damage-inducible protein DinB [Roseovarius sp. A21]|uniref:Damage-inducible protein DinB n=1 Tax=Roseovarius bejariae TaxID=2576383 RepID=A0A844CXC9_9RHOB|nr:DinB family protein [Roseovarius bejariae]MRU16759.1 damage-inducible protein DinB [Roseovarius bejariae]